MTRYLATIHTERGVYSSFIVHAANRIEARCYAFTARIGWIHAQFVIVEEIEE